MRSKNQPVSVMQRAIKACSQSPFHIVEASVMFQLRTPTVSRALHPLLSDLLNTTLEIDPRISDAFLSHQA